LTTGDEKMQNRRTPLIMVSGIEGMSPGDMVKFVPQRKSRDAVGYDVKAYHILDRKTREVIGHFPVTIYPGQSILVGAGYVAAIPEGIDCQVRPRSGLAARHGIILSNAPGTVDPDYRGEIGCLLYNTSEESYTVEFGDRIAQLIFTPIILPEFKLVASTELLPKTTRGDGGFGSTGKGMNDGGGDEEYREAIKVHDIALMKAALLVGEGSNCVRGCKMDDNGVPIHDQDGRFIGQSRKIGCVIARGRSIVASGCNEQYPGCPPCAEVGCVREKEKIPSGTQLERCNAIHAEDMAMNNALISGINLNGCIVVCTAEPCRSCARKLAGLPIDALVVLHGGYSTCEGIEIVEQAGIQVRIIDPSEVG